MATDHAGSVETNPATDAYVSPTVDFLLLSAVTALVSLACAAVIIL